MTVRVLQQNPPALRIRRSAKCPDATLAEVQQGVLDVLLLEVPVEVIQRVSLSNAAEVNSHTWFQGNGMLRKEADFLAANPVLYSTERSSSRNGLATHGIPPQQHEWADGDIECALRELRVA